MQLFAPIQELFGQIDYTLTLLNNEVYTKPSKLLYNASIGQHVRHIIELFIELNNGYENGTINYELRKRNYQIETDTHFASEQINALLKKINKPDKPLLLATDYSKTDTDSITVQTNYYRELIYNLEHTVHHMALMRVAINEYTTIELNASFGVAVSTLKHKETIACAQ
jgi:hypothetical protein